MVDYKALGPVHPEHTRRRKLTYFFYVKHHKNSYSDDAQWSLSNNDEFRVFDEADNRDSSSSKGDLYGVFRQEDDTFEVLGTRGEQLAEFPVAPPHQHWHGYPLWPIRRHKDGDRKARPSPEALAQLVDKRVLTPKQKSRLAGGKSI